MMSILPINFSFFSDQLDHNWIRNRSLGKARGFEKSRIRHADRTEAMRRDCMPKSRNVALTNHRRVFSRDQQNNFVSVREPAINKSVRRPLARTLSSQTNIRLVTKRSRMQWGVQSGDFDEDGAYPSRVIMLGSEFDDCRWRDGC